MNHIDFGDEGGQKGHSVFGPLCVDAPLPEDGVLERLGLHAGKSQPLYPSFNARCN